MTNREVKKQMLGIKPGPLVKKPIVLFQSTGLLF
jgi:hypothetical protein